MGIISRFKEIMEANINTMFDKLEDPSKMVDQKLRELPEQLAEVKKETSEIMAEAQMAKKRCNDLKKQIEEYVNAAGKAIDAGNDGDAVKLIERKQQIESEKLQADSVYQLAKENADKMRQMYNKLANDITLLQSKRSTIKAQIGMAKAQDKVTDMTAKMNKNDVSSSFGSFEQKAEKMLAASNARAELSGVGMPTDEVGNIKNKYATSALASVNEELEAMKAARGK